MWISYHVKTVLCTDDCFDVQNLARVFPLQVGGRQDPLL